MGGGKKEREGGQCALAVSSYTPRGHPVAIPGSALVAEGTGFWVGVCLPYMVNDVTICHDHAGLLWGTPAERG